MNIFGPRHATRSRRRVRLAATFVPLGLCLLAPSLAEAAEITVDTTADAIDDAGDCSLREAIIAANANVAVDGCTAGEDGVDTITLPAGTYTLSLTGVDESHEPDMMMGFQVVIDPDPNIGDLDITEDLEITGAGASETIVEWGEMDKDRVFHVQAPTTDVAVSITGLTVQGGQTDGETINPGDPQDDQWRFSRHGGGIAVGAGASAKLASETGPGDTGHPEEEDPSGEASLTLTDCIVTGNSAGGDGGGLYAAGPITATGVVISGNTAEFNGGGVYNDAESTYASCLVGENQGENGGGMFDTGSHGTSLIASTFAANTAVGGAGIASRSLVDSTATNCTFSANEASDIGGGILTNGSVTLRSSTVYANVALSDADFASAGLTSFGNGSFSIQSTLLAANAVGETLDVANCGCTGGGCMADVVSEGYNLEDIDSCNLDQDTDLPSTEPMVMDLGDYGGPVPTHALLVDSPALDAASDETCPDTDARGVARPGGAGCDIGAFELSPDEVDGDADGYCVGVVFDEMPVCLDGSMPGDCDGENPDAFPGNPEVCDGVDNDCNEEIDEGLDVFEFWPDSDGDGFGDADAEPTMACDTPEGFTDNPDDCDDSEGGVNPDAEEICDNNVDDNCNGEIDEGCEGGTDTGGDTGGDEVGDTGDTGTGDDAGADMGDEGCNCSTEPTRGSGFGFLALLGLGLGLRRRR